VSSHETSEANHGKTAVLKFLLVDLSSSCLIGGVAVAPVDAWLSGSTVRLALHLSPVLDSLNYRTEDDELSPPLRIGLHDGINWVSGSDIVGFEGSESGGPDPAYGGKHGRTSVGDLGLTCELRGYPVAEEERIKLERKTKNMFW